MADSESLMEAGKRLAGDLRAIRRSRSIDVKEVLDATRLAEDVIEQLEATALMGNPMFNRVYLRSMFSSYASVLGIQTSEMMTALEEALAGKYIGSLATIYLGDDHAEEVSGSESLEKGAEESLHSKLPSDLTTAPDKSKTSTKKVASESTDKGQDTGATQKESQNKPTGIRSSVGDLPADTGAKEAAEGKNQPDTAAQKEPATQKDPAAQKEPATQKDSAVQKDPVVHEELAAEADSANELKPGSRDATLKSVQTAPDVGSSNTLSTTKLPSKTVLLPNMSGFLILVVAGIALVSLIWFAVSWILTPKVDPDELIVKEDTTQAVTRILPERIQLSDTIQVDLIAYHEALDPIRVKADRDLRRPYWIEHTERRVFEMLETIEFEREVDHARILIDGYAIPTSWYASSVRAEITREKTQAWLDSLTSSGTFPPRSILPE